MSLEMKIHREVELQLDDMYNKAEELGNLASQVLGRERGKAQLRNLENIANSTLKVSDVLDYIKRQTARMGEWQEQEFGKKMLAAIQSDIRKSRDDVVKHLSKNFEDVAEHWLDLKKQDIYLQIIRGFIKQLIIHFEWLLEERK